MSMSDNQNLVGKPSSTSSESIRIQGLNGDFLDIVLKEGQIYLDGSRLNLHKIIDPRVHTVSIHLSPESVDFVCGLNAYYIIGIRQIFGIHQQKLQELEQLLNDSGIRFRKYTAPVTDLNVLLKKHNVR